MASAEMPRFEARFLAPRHWPAWLAMGLLRALVCLPHSTQVFLGARLGRLLRRLGKSRVRVARRNLEICFPQWTEDKREQTLDASFEALGQMIFEIGFAWWGSPRRHRPLYRIDGLEKLEAAQNSGHGVILLFCHFTPLELAGRLLAYHVPIAALYREHGSDLLEYIVRRQRLNYGDELFNRDQLRGMVRYLRKGGTLWYAPDQDYERGERRFVPFFGVQTATITSAIDLARMGNAKLMATRVVRDDQGYRITILDTLDGIPSDDTDDDLTRINAVVEDLIRKNPNQYFWVHRRFKNRPPGEDSLY